MAKVDLSIGIEGVHGKPSKGSNVVMRQKKYRAENGKVVRRGAQEAFKREPRDFEKTPPKGAELANMRSFGDASLVSGDLIRAAKLTEDELAAMSKDERAHVMELREAYADFRQRFYAQFKKPDPEAPYEKTLRPGSMVYRKKQYLKIDTFIQAILRERIRRSQN